MKFDILCSKREVVKSGRKDKVVTPLTSIDSHAGHFNIYVVYFFKGIADIEKIKESLSKTLLDFPETEGRYRGKKNDKIEVISSGEGVKFVVEEADITIEEIQNEEIKGENWECLVENINFEELIVGDGAGLAIKIICYKNGGYSVGITMNHALTDAGGFYYFIQCWSKKFKGEEYPKPFLNRELLENRPGEKKIISHMNKKTDGFMCLTKEETDEHYKMYMELDPMSIENKIIHFTSLELKNMKKAALKEVGRDEWISTNDILSMHIWDILSKITGDKNGKSKLFIAVNIREKSNPKLGNEYFGNGSLPIVIDKSFKELTEKNNALHAVELRKRINEYGSEKIKEQIMWMKEKQGIHVFADFNPFENEMNISSFAKFSVFSAEFGTGKAIDAYIPPVICPGVIRVMPRADEDGVNLYLSMYKSDIEKVESVEWEKELHKYRESN